MPATFEQGVAFLWTANPLSKGLLFFFPPFCFCQDFCYPLSKGWLCSFIKSYFSFACHSFFCFFHPWWCGWWHLTDTCGRRLPLWVCWTCSTGASHILWWWGTPWCLLARLLAGSLLCHPPGHWSHFSAGVLLSHWGHTFSLSWRGTPSHPRHLLPQSGLLSTCLPHRKTPGALCSPSPSVFAVTWCSGGRCALWSPAHCGGLWQSQAGSFYQGLWMLVLPFHQGICPLLQAPCCCCWLSLQVSLWQQFCFFVPPPSPFPAC